VESSDCTANHDGQYLTEFGTDTALQSQAFPVDIYRLFRRIIPGSTVQGRAVAPVNSRQNHYET